MARIRRTSAMRGGAYAASAAAGAPRYRAGSRVSTASPPTASTRTAPAAGREATTSDQLGPHEVQGRAVVHPEARPHARPDVGQELPPALGLAVVVDAVRPRQEPEPAHGLRRPVERRDGLLEPAQRARAEPAEHGPAPPRLLEEAVDAVGEPRPEQGHDAAPADVDQVLREQVGPQVALHGAAGAVAPEQRDVAGLRPPAERAVEPHDVVVGVPGGGRQEADPRALHPRQAQDVVVEQRTRLHGEPSATERDDLRGAVHAATIGAPRRPRRDFLPPVEDRSTAGPARAPAGSAGP